MFAKVLSITTDEEGRVIVNLISDTGKYYSEDGTDVVTSIFGYKRKPKKYVKDIRKKVASCSFRVNSFTNEIMDFSDTLRKAIIA